MQELGLTVEAAGAQAVTVHLPFDAGLVRVGGSVCGHALLTAADLAAVLTLSSALGGWRQMATVGQTIPLARPVSNA